MTHELDKGRDRLRKLVASTKVRGTTLPLVHSTDAYALADMVEADQITPQACPVFTGDTLTYLFYGRPAFRPNLNAEPTSMGHYLPIVLIFRQDFVFKIKRAFPFDSGAFARYARYLHRHMVLGDFGLDPDQSTPGRVVEHFFGSNEAYMRGEGRLREDTDPAQFEAKAYTTIVTDKSANDIDSRGAAVELQVEEALELSTTVEAVILPNQFATGATGRALEAAKIQLIPYRISDRTRPNEYMATLHDLCVSYYLHRRFLDGDKL